MLPEDDVQEITEWVDSRNDRVPADIRDKIRYEMDTGNHAITVFECHPPWRQDFGPDWSRLPAARLRFTMKTNLWSLYWPDRNSVFHEYNLVDPTANVDDLLAEIDRDPTSIFWG